MSALRYYDLPFESPNGPRRGGWLDRVCRSAWAWASQRQQAAGSRTPPASDRLSPDRPAQDRPAPKGTGPASTGHTGGQ